ncbi:unnamed protein product [Vicia faba]|uniref:Uncharacterized protein n=1 Tax=Vicia faba TaxID=3906 RepID=A0AAV0ZCC8_VICFA|nr:unnamed protein product [Vicia faba]
MYAMKQTILTLFPHSPPLPPPEEREQFPEIQQEPNHQLPEHPGDQAPQKPGPSPQQSKTSPSISSSSWPFTSSDCYFIWNFLNDEVGPSHITPREGGEAGPSKKNVNPTAFDQEVSSALNRGDLPTSNQQSAVQPAHNTGWHSRGCRNLRMTIYIGPLMLSIWPVKTAMIDRAHILLQKKEGDHSRGTKGCEACARGGSP